MKLKKTIILSFIPLTLIFIGTYTFFQFFFFYQVEGTSMYPTLDNGEYVLARSYHLSHVNRGDIVGYYSTKYKTEFIKRVVGLPGDQVQVKNSVVYVNGKIVEEIPDTIRYVPDFGPIQVPKNNVFVLGDDLPSSIDSRHMGPIPFSQIKGVLVFY
jgi:signal peptidase I